MQMGRGDSRNFSNQYGGQPPDYNKNTVGMDDLRRLTNKSAANRQASQQMSFGPTSMFGSRSNSGRKMGPGGSLSRTGEDSGASSRTGTPPQQKEKESATSANAFRYVVKKLVFMTSILIHPQLACRARIRRTREPSLSSLRIYLS
jgi:translation initiation factor 4G